MARQLFNNFLTFNKGYLSFNKLGFYDYLSTFMTISLPSISTSVVNSVKTIAKINFMKLTYTFSIKLFFSIFRNHFYQFQQYLGYITLGLPRLSTWFYWLSVFSKLPFIIQKTAIIKKKQIRNNMRIFVQPQHLRLEKILFTV